MDEQILELLKADARVSDKDISVQLDIDEQVVTSTRKQLEDDNIIVKYSAIINPRKDQELGKVMAFIEVKVSPERDKGFDNLAERVQLFPEVNSVYLMSGSYDLLVSVKGDSLHEVASFVSEKLSPLGRIVSSTTHFLLKTYKENGIIMSEQSDSPSRLAVSF
jgi:DNA-binding Lrp family transcriptional regulator